MNRKLQYQPRRKRKSLKDLPSELPIPIGSKTNPSLAAAEWPVYFGRLIDDYVLIEDEEQSATLYKNGSFGTFNNEWDELYYQVVCGIGLDKNTVKKSSKAKNNASSQKYEASSSEKNIESDDDLNVENKKNEEINTIKKSSKAENNALHECEESSSEKNMHWDGDLKSENKAKEEKYTIENSSHAEDNTTSQECEVSSSEKNMEWDEDLKVENEVDENKKSSINCDESIEMVDKSDPNEVSSIENSKNEVEVSSENIKYEISSAVKEQNDDEHEVLATNNSGSKMEISPALSRKSKYERPILIRHDLTKKPIEIESISNENGTKGKILSTENVQNEVQDLSEKVSPAKIEISTLKNDPIEIKSVENKLAENKSNENKPVEHESVENKSVENKSLEMKSTKILSKTNPNPPSNVENIDENKENLCASCLETPFSTFKLKDTGEAPRPPKYLRLGLEEALFISYTLGALVVSKDSSQLDIDEMWSEFCKIKKNFPLLYAVYHHFRCKRWVVKYGLKFGGDFMLYPYGPAYYHGLHLVWVECLWKDTLERDSMLSTRKFGLAEMTSLERLASHVSKNVLICQVLRPRTLTDENLLDIECLKSFQICESILHRMRPTDTRQQQADKFS